jgi:glycerol-3-phosphate acyltransferase PlsX
MVTIAVDMMGSDLGPEELAEGIKIYLKENKAVSFICFGDGKRMTSLAGISQVKIVDCADVVPMETSVLGFMRLKNSSMYKAIEAVKSGEAQGMVTAGSTGGFLTGSTLLLKNIDGVERAGFCSYFPTTVKGKWTAILDIGASNTNTASELVGFAKLGNLYSKYVMGVDNPTVYLLSNGIEEGKGLEETRGAYEVLKNDKSLNFKGNVEAREALDGTKDVIVTTGYPGNIFLKATEGMVITMSKLTKKAFKRNFFSKIGYLLAKKGFDEIKETMNYKQTGGAILLGINGVVVKTHGNSDREFFYYSLALAYKMITTGFVDKVREEFKKD